MQSDGDFFLLLGETENQCFVVFDLVVKQLL